MKLIFIIMLVILITGCSTIVLPEGYYQPHIYSDEKLIEHSKLAVIYGRCDRNIEEKKLGKVSIRGVDGIMLDHSVLKVYVKPGIRKVTVGVRKEKHSKSIEIDYDFKAGNKYQLISTWDDEIYGDFWSSIRGFKIDISDMGKEYIPPKLTFRDHNHNDPLVIKDPKADIIINDCLTFMPAINKPLIKKEYRNIFIKQGLKL